MNKVEVQNLDLDQLIQKDNFRTDVNDDDLAQLMKSIKQVGLMQPIAVQVVQKANGGPTGKFKVIFGNRRLHAVRKLGRAEIAAVVYPANLPEDEVLKMHVQENVIRRDVTSADEGRVYQKLVDKGLQITEIAAWIGVPPSRINRCLNAHNEIDDDLKPMLAPSGQGAKALKGTIGSGVAAKIVNATKTGIITRKQSRELMLMAAERPKHMRDNITQYINAMAVGQDVTGKGFNPEKQSRFQLLVVLDEKETVRLKNKYVKSKMYRSVSDVARAILRGKLDETFKLAYDIRGRRG